MAKLFNLARMTVASAPGTGTISLGVAVQSFLTFALAGVNDQDIVRYAIEDGQNREIGYGLYSTSGLTLTRNVSQSTNSNSAISATASAQVFITAGKEDFLALPGAQGRLTLATATPVMTSTQSGKNTVFWTPYGGRSFPLYDGSSFNTYDYGAELSQLTTDNTKSPAAVANNSNYDIFGWLDSGTYRATRGPAWTSDTARGTGAATTELVLQNGIWLNKIAITNGPAASRGTYLGSVRSNGSALIDWIKPAYTNLASMTSGVLGVFNFWNRINVNEQGGDGHTAWSYLSTSWRQSNAANNTNSKISFLNPIPTAGEDAFVARLVQLCQQGTAEAAIGVGVNSTTVPSGKTGASQSGAGITEATAEYMGFGQFGWNTIYALEYGSAGSTAFLGQDGITATQAMSLSLGFRM